MNKRNYTIDFFRMIFMIIICIHHIQGRLEFKFIQSGYICVEFFFILSGFYLYRSFKKNKELDGIKYTLKKVKRMYPHYVFSFIVCLIIIIMRGIMNNNLDAINTIFTSISEILMIQNIGIFNGGLNQPLWYFSVLIFGSYLIYELLKKDEKLFLKILGPIIVLFTFALIKTNTSTIENWDIIYGLYMPLLRGIADLTIGCILAWIYEEYNIKIQKFICDKKLISNIIEFLTYILISYIIINKTDYELYCLILFPLLILFANSEFSICSRLFDKKLFKKNGDLTYAMYLNHYSILMITATIYNKVLSNILNKIEIIVLYVIIVIIYSYITDKFVKFITNRKVNKNDYKGII